MKKILSSFVVIFSAVHLNAKDVGADRSAYLQQRAQQEIVTDTAHGDIARMRELFRLLIERALATGDKEAARQAIFWHTATLVRFQQDAECSKNPSVGAGLGLIMFEHGQLLEQLIENGMYTEDEITSLAQDALKRALVWVEEKTKNKELVAPYGVHHYGMGAYVSEAVDAGFVPQEEWHKHRMEALRKMQELLAQRRRS